MQFRYLLCDAKNIFTNTHTFIYTFTCMNETLMDWRASRAVNDIEERERAISTFSVLLIHRTCMYIYFLFVFPDHDWKIVSSINSNSIWYVMCVCVSLLHVRLVENKTIERTITNITNFNFKLFKLRENWMKKVYWKIKILVFGCSFRSCWKIVDVIFLV